MRKGERTRQQILEIAEVAVLQKGFGGTSIDELVAEANITKSGFLYHFRDKNQLALALVNRYIENDRIILDDIFNRANDLSDDPLQRLLIGLKLLAELLQDIEGGHPGCMAATICYQERLFDREVINCNRDGVIGWRIRFRAMLDDIMERYDLTEPHDLDDVADLIATTVEGGLVLAKTIGDPPILPRQVLLLRSTIKLLFKPKIN